MQYQHGGSAHRFRSTPAANWRTPRQGSLEEAETLALAARRYAEREAATRARRTRNSGGSCPQTPITNGSWPQKRARIIGISPMGVYKRVQREAIPFTDHRGRHWFRRDHMERLALARRGAPDPLLHRRAGCSGFCCGSAHPLERQLLNSRVACQAALRANQRVVDRRSRRTVLDGEITHRDDLGTDLFGHRQPSKATSPTGGTELVTHPRAGDVVVHWHKTLLLHPPSWGWSRASGVYEDTEMSWQARGTVGRAQETPDVERPAWRMPLEGYTPLVEPVTIDEVRRSEREAERPRRRVWRRSTARRSTSPLASATCERHEPNRRTS